MNDDEQIAFHLGQVRKLRDAKIHKRRRNFQRKTMVFFTGLAVLTPAVLLIWLWIYNSVFGG